jgi:hypothetical protein
MIWDFCPDMMHIIKTFFERLLLGVFTGARKPTAFKPTEPVKPAEGATRTTVREYRGKKRTYDQLKEDYDATQLSFAECLFDAEAQKIVDERVKNLVGYPNWIKASMVHTRLWMAHTLALNILGFFCVYTQF